MCRLFGLSAGARPVTASFWLLDAPDSLRIQSRREPDGTGLGYFDPEGRPHVDKQPIAAFEDRAFAREAKHVEACTFVAHIRFASTGALELRNTHPFEQDDRLFAHNGVLEDLPAIEQRLGDAIDLVHGDTDSERLFALITKETREHGGDLTEGVSAAIEWVADSVPVLSLNFVLITPEELWALRYPDTHELHVLERPAGDAIDQVSSQGTRVHSEHGTQCDTVVIASEVMDDDPGWRLLHSGELLHVDRGLHVRSTTILDRPPAHLLKLSDLEGKAKSSQS